MMEPTTWLYTNGAESVRLDVRPSPDAVRLVIEGPGETVSSYDFPPGTAVRRFREAYEEQLLAAGYRLQLVSERRGETEQVVPHERRRDKHERGGM